MAKKDAKAVARMESEAPRPGQVQKSTIGCKVVPDKAIHSDEIHYKIMMKVFVLFAIFVLGWG